MRLVELLEKAKTSKVLGYGICTSLYDMEISEEDKELLDTYLHKNLPERKYLLHGTKIFSFPYKDVESRKTWIDEQITKLKNYYYGNHK